MSASPFKHATRTGVALRAAGNRQRDCDARRLLHRARRNAESIPFDYRQRHPIVLKETPQTVELFIGNRRGTLTATQRAEVLALAQNWRQEATGGILVDVPTGTPNAGAAGAAYRRFARSSLPPACPLNRSNCGRTTPAIHASSRR